MTNPIEAARAALDQYTAERDTAKRKYESALFDSRFNYLNTVAGLSGIAMENLPTYGDGDRLPVFIGYVKDIPESAQDLFSLVMQEGVVFAEVPKRFPESAQRYDWSSSEGYAASSTRQEGSLVKFKPDHATTVMQWIKTDAMGNAPVFAFYPASRQMFIAAFLTELSALMTPPAPVVEVVGNLGRLNLNAIENYGCDGVLRMLWRHVDGNVIYDHLWQDDQARWRVFRGTESDQAATEHGHRSPDVVNAVCLWMRDHIPNTPVEFLLNPA